MLILHPVKQMDFSHIDEFEPRLKQRKLKQDVRETKASRGEQNAWNPEMLENGKWVCNHKCKDKTA